MTKVTSYFQWVTLNTGIHAKLTDDQKAEEARLMHYVLDLEESNAGLLTALQVLLHRYVGLVDSGDCYNGDSSTEAEVIQARAAIERATRS